LKNITESYFSERKDLESFMSLIKSLEDNDLKSLLQHKYKELNQLDYEIVNNIYKKTQLFVRESLEKIKDDNVVYLSPLIGFLEESPLEIFTLNYDGLVELFCERNKINYYDGFSPNWNPKIFENDIPIKIYKLHGSLYWFKTTSGKVMRIPVIGLNLENIKYISLERLSEMIIYPTINKEKHSEIYTWLNNKFITTLGITDLLVVAGYSFRDKDIRSIVKDSMATRKLWILIISPNATVIKNTYFNNEEEKSSRVIAINYSERCIG
jgi:hypothetical protein